LKVKCVDDRGMTSLTKGRVYEVVKVLQSGDYSNAARANTVGAGYELQGDGGTLIFAFADRFDVLEDDPGGPAPEPEPKIIDLVKQDLDARERKGIETYGSTLRASSTNDALQYAYEEALDLVMYLRQELDRRAAGAK
jgi:hypothetical protein